MEKPAFIEINDTVSVTNSLNDVTIVATVKNPYIALATSQNTRRAYQSDIRHYEMTGGKLPATPAMVADYLQQFASQLNPRTLQRRLVAIRHWHVYQGFPDPTQHPAIQKTMTGILRTHGRPKAKARALMPDELKLIHDYLVKENSLTAIRDDALLQVGFFGALRRSELVGIQVEHLTWHKSGVDILLPFSKTDQTREGQYCAIPYGNIALCPLRALKHWLNISGIQQGAIFRRISLGEHIGRDPLTPLSVNHVLKKWARSVNLNTVESLSAHSLRRGLATSAAQSGAPLATIMRAGRWKQTNTVMEYIESSERFTDNAAQRILNHIEI